MTTETKSVGLFTDEEVASKPIDFYLGPMSADMIVAAIARHNAVKGEYAVDYKELLKKYMRLVLDVEGIDFLYCAGSSIGKRSLSKEEIEALEAISKEVRE